MTEMKDLSNEALIEFNERLIIELRRTIQTSVAALNGIQARLNTVSRELDALQRMTVLPVTPPQPAPAAPITDDEGDPGSLFPLLAAVRRNNFVVLDTETTGLHDGEICQIAIIDHEGKTLLDQLVKPTSPISADATRIHGITNDQVKDSPGWADVALRVKQILAGKDVVVYNAVYDRKMMHKSAEHAGIEKIDWKALSPWYCAMEAYAEHHGEWNDYHQSFRWQKLAVAANQCGVKVENAHNALGDCLMTLGVVRELERRYQFGPKDRLSV